MKFVFEFDENDTRTLIAALDEAPGKFTRRLANRLEQEFVTQKQNQAKPVLKEIKKDEK